MEMIYRIKIRGQLGPEWTGWFAGMVISLEDNGHTILSGQVKDQAVLYGLLKKVRDLGMPLVSVSSSEQNNFSPDPARD